MAARKPGIALAVLALLAALSAPAFAQTNSFTDSIFLNADWTVTNEVLILGGTSTGTQTNGGDPGTYRRIVNTLNSAIGFGFSNTVFGYHERAGAIFNPSATGPISTIDYLESSIRLAAGQQACAPALRQGGVIYYGPIFLTPAALNVWTPTSQLGLTAASFDAIAPGVQNPDFSPSGPPIQFGFMRGNSTSVGGAGSTLTGGIDNWLVHVHYNGATAAKTTSWGRIKTLYAK